MIAIASRSAADRLARRAHRAAHRPDRIPERAGAETELEPTAAELIERGGLLGQHRRWPQGQVGDIGKDADLFGLAEDDRAQGQCVEVPAVVGVILDSDQVEPEIVENPRDLEGAVRIADRGIEEEAELNIVAVIRHVDSPG